MNTKKMLPLFVLVPVVVVLGVALGVLNHADTEEEDTSIALCSLDADSVIAIAYKDASDGATLESALTKTDDTWTLDSDPALPLDQSKAQGVADSMTALTALRELSDDADVASPAGSCRVAFGERRELERGHLFKALAPTGDVGGLVWAEHIAGRRRVGRLAADGIDAVHAEHGQHACAGAIGQAHGIAPSGLAFDVALAVVGMHGKRHGAVAIDDGKFDQRLWRVLGVRGGRYGECKCGQDEKQKQRDADHDDASLEGAGCNAARGRMGLPRYRPVDRRSCSDSQ